MVAPAELGADAVLVGTVEVYKERSGSAIGLERPQDAAEVGFAVQLISVKDGVPLWTGQYHEQQRPANQDLTGFLERGPRYLTVDELADSAAEPPVLLLVHAKRKALASASTPVTLVNID